VKLLIKPLKGLLSNLDAHSSFYGCQRVQKGSLTKVPRTKMWKKFLVGFLGKFKLFGKLEGELGGQLEPWFNGLPKLEGGNLPTGN